MKETIQFFFDHFVLIWFIALFWVIGSFGLKHYRNQKRGRYLENPSEDDVLWSEKYASGKSYRSIRTRLGGASNCLTISITEEALYIQPFFPFKILGPHFDLIHKIPLGRITNVGAGKGILSRGVDIDFLDSEDCPRRINLVPKNQSGFLQHLDATRALNAQQVAAGNVR